ncbi:MAG: S8 family serine peptidase [bacterium]|nr:S8 family serine peptidase [bacterium]
MRKGFHKPAIALAIGSLIGLGVALGLPLALEAGASGPMAVPAPLATAPPPDVLAAAETPPNPPVERADPTPRPEAGASARPRSAGGATEDASPTSDDTPPLRTRLERAIARAASERAFTIHPAIVETVLERGDVRILFPIDVDDHAATRTALAPTTRGDLRFFPLLGQGAARVDGEQLVLLIESGLLPAIDLDAIHRPSLATTIPLIRADAAHLAGDDGAGRVVAVLDTGVDTAHEMFAGRIVEEACFALLGTCPDDSSSMTGPGAAVPCTGPGCGHGTSVAGIAVGRSADDSLVGVAPGAQLIAIQVFSELPAGDIGAYTSDIVAGLQHVLGLSITLDVDAVNLSLGGTTYGSVDACEAGSASATSAVGRLRDAGIVTVAAGGNDGLVDALTSPACIGQVIGVGATTLADDVPGFSNSIDLLTMLAPGSSIESAANGGGTSRVGGTSMAAPHVAGAIAVLRQRHPAATPAEIENALVLSGTPVYDPRGDVTLPRLDVQGASDLLAAAAAAVGSGSSGGASGPSSASDGGGGGGACGLVGLEPFLVVGAIRLLRRRRDPAAALRGRG